MAGGPSDTRTHLPAGRWRVAESLPTPVPMKRARTTDDVASDRQVRGAPEEIGWVSEVFHENSKLRSSDHDAYSWIQFVNSSPQVQDVVSRPFTRYRGTGFVELPRTFAPSAHPFEEILTQRRSRREYSGKPITAGSLAKLLHL